MAAYNFQLDVTGYPNDLNNIYCTLTSSDGWVTGGEGSVEVTSPANGGTVTFVFDQNVGNHGGIAFNDNATVWFTIEGKDSSGLGYPAVRATIGPYAIADVGTVV